MYERIGIFSLIQAYPTLFNGKVGDVPEIAPTRSLTISLVVIAHARLETKIHVIQTLFKTVLSVVSLPELQAF